MTSMIPIGQTAAETGTHSGIEIAEIRTSTCRLPVVHHGMTDLGHGTGIITTTDNREIAIDTNETVREVLLCPLRHNLLRDLLPQFS